MSKIYFVPDELSRRKIFLRPGTDSHLLGVLRSGNCEVKWAADVAQAFLDYQKYASMGTYF